MINYRLENEDKQIQLVISSISQKTTPIYFAGILGVIMFLTPILMIMSSPLKITFGSIIVCLIAWFISGYFVKLYLWNKYGEEVFIIKGNVMETYNDFKLFRDNGIFRNFIKMEVLFFLGGNIVYASKLDRTHHLLNSNQLSAIGFKLDDEIVTSHKELPISDIIKISTMLRLK